MYLVKQFIQLDEHCITVMSMCVALNAWPVFRNFFFAKSKHSFPYNHLHTQCVTIHKWVLRYRLLLKNVHFRTHMRCVALLFLADLLIYVTK